jgi:hypothetical protein
MAMLATAEMPAIDPDVIFLGMFFWPLRRDEADVSVSDTVLTGRAATHQGEADVIVCR